MVDLQTAGQHPLVGRLRFVGQAVGMTAGRRGRWLVMGLAQS